MSALIKLKHGLDIPLAGEAERVVSRLVKPGTAAVCPSDFKGLAPRLLVHEGDHVLAGSPVLADKKNPDILVTAPLSGTVREIVRGEKRKLLAVLITPDEVQESVDFGHADVTDAAAVRDLLLKSGLWVSIISRPYGIVADPAVTPKAIFVSLFDTAPLAPDAEFTLSAKTGAMQTAINALSSIAKVHLGICKCQEGGSFAGFENAEYHVFQGKHPAGNVGVQISHIDHIRKGETVWTVSPMLLAAIGTLLGKGKLDLRRRVAVCGPAAIEPSYIETWPGMPMSCLAGHIGTQADGVRIISGDVLSGRNAGCEGFLGFFDDQITLVREGREYELFGWLRPFRFNQFSADHTYFNWCLGWLTPKRRYNMDTNLHGGPRAFVMSDSYYAKYLPMDIFPLYLVKACLAGDIDKMEQFGIYEVLPEDLALCEFIDPSKNYIQEIISDGIDLMIKEMA